VCEQICSADTSPRYVVKIQEPSIHHRGDLDYCVIVLYCIEIKYSADKSFVSVPAVVTPPVQTTKFPPSFRHSFVGKTHGERLLEQFETPHRNRADPPSRFRAIPPLGTLAQIFSYAVLKVQFSELSLSFLILYFVSVCLCNEERCTEEIGSFIDVKSRCFLTHWL